MTLILHVLPKNDSAHFSHASCSKDNYSISIYHSWCHIFLHFDLVHGDPKYGGGFTQSSDKWKMNKMKLNEPTVIVYYYNFAFVIGKLLYLWSMKCVCVDAVHQQYITFYSRRPMKVAWGKILFSKIAKTGPVTHSTFTIYTSNAFLFGIQYAGIQYTSIQCTRNRWWIWERSKDTSYHPFVLGIHRYH